MDFVFKEMSEEEAREIAAWRYDPPYDFYDVVAKDPEDLDELLDPKKRADYFSATSDGELVGYFCFGCEARVPGGDYSGGAVDVGLGMRPNLTGKGLGLEFLESGLEFAGEEFSPVRLRLSVAEFNGRAITVYERAGFSKTGGFTQRTDGAGHAFVLMARPA